MSRLTGTARACHEHGVVFTREPERTQQTGGQIVQVQGRQHREEEEGNANQGGVGSAEARSSRRRRSVGLGPSTDPVSTHVSNGFLPRNMLACSRSKFD